MVDVVIEVWGGAAHVLVRKGSGISVQVIDYEAEPHHPEPETSEYDYVTSFL